MTTRLPIAATCGHSESDPEPLRVGDLATQTGKTVRALHLYEELGLLAPSERSKGNYRLYDGSAVLRVRWISKLQEMGLSLPDIREVLARWESSGSAADAMSDIRVIYARKIEETRAQIARLKVLERELEGSLQYLDTCDTCAPERLVNACTRCDLHDESAPELVAGLHATPSAG
ncbi:MAG: MerR family transcriptional regulator [Deltaproteobacteria bacterium]|nr:MerR family transcriptional regulator [Deltaproteobacteria bacterium]